MTIKSTLKTAHRSTYNNSFYNSQPPPKKKKQTKLKASLPKVNCKQWSFYLAKMHSLTHLLTPHTHTQASNAIELIHQPLPFVTHAINQVSLSRVVQQIANQSRNKKKQAKFWQFMIRTKHVFQCELLGNKKKRLE